MILKIDSTRTPGQTLVSVSGRISEQIINIEGGIRDIRELFWCIASNGTIGLYWQRIDGELYESDRIAYLSGNGRWDLAQHKLWINREENNHTGNLVLKPENHKTDETFTIILAGRNK